MIIVPEGEWTINPQFKAKTLNGSSDEFACGGVRVPTPEDGFPVLKFLMMKWVEETHALEEGGPKDHFAGQVPGDAGFVEACQHDRFDHIVPLVFSESGGHGWILESSHDGSKKALPGIIAFQGP